MNVLVWSPFFHPDVGGIESLLASLLPRIRDRGINVSVIASHGPNVMPERSAYEGIPVYRLRFREAVQRSQPLEILRLRAQVADLKEQFRPDIVHVHFSDPSVFFHLETDRSHPARTLATLHQDYRFFGIEPGMRSLLTKTLNAASWVTGVSTVTLEGARAFDRNLDGRSSVIYNGIDPSGYDNLTPIDYQVPTLLCLGRLVEEKGFEEAAMVLDSLSEQFPSLQLRVAGDGPSEQALRSLVDERGLSERTLFLGRVSPEDVPAILSEATIVLMPSRSEAFPMVMLEAGLAGRPVVATNVGGVSEAVVDGETGVIVEPGDRAGLISSVASLLKSPTTCSAMGQAARSRILDRFLLDRTVEDYVTLYSQLTTDAAVSASRLNDG